MLFTGEWPPAKIVLCIPGFAMPTADQYFIKFSLLMHTTRTNNRGKFKPFLRNACLDTFLAAPCTSATAE